MLLDLRDPPMPYTHARFYKKGLLVLTRSGVTVTDVGVGKALTPAFATKYELLWQCGPYAVYPPGHTLLYRCDAKKPLNFALAVHENEWTFIWVGEKEDAIGLHVRLPKFKPIWKFEPDVDDVDEVAELGNCCSPKEAARRIAKAHEIRKEMMRPKT